MIITEELIQKLESLSKLKLNETEKIKVKEDLTRMVEMFNTIAEVDTNGVEPLIHLTDNQNLMRADVVGRELTVNEALKNAPQTQASYFTVPKIIE